ncbi:MAG: hypothetical protein GF410_16445 [Chitinivibrionales bacterium]|nr:hypothetical protein [Chitinivibrionales bacterium]
MAVPPKCTNGDPVYTYDALNRVVTMTSPAGVTEYVYDSTSGRLSKIISPEDDEYTFGYDHGQLDTIGRPNGIATHYTFDDNGNLTLMDHRLGASSLRSFAYTYDANGMRTDMTDNDGAHDYYYDTLYQITEATHPTVGNPPETFTYDAVGNRTGGNYSHNSVNRMLADNDGYAYEYDADGNMTAKIDKISRDTTKYTWSIENRLTKVERPDGDIVEYVYGPLGRRLRKVHNGLAKEYRYDGEDLILEMNPQDTILASYTFGPGIDQPLAMKRGNNAYYYLQDGLGSVSAIINSTGAVVQEYRYSVFGKIVEQLGDSIENSFTYTGRELIMSYDDELVFNKIVFSQYRESTGCRVRGGPLRLRRALPG